MGDTNINECINIMDYDNLNDNQYIDIGIDNNIYIINDTISLLDNNILENLYIDTEQDINILHNSSNLEINFDEIRHDDSNLQQNSNIEIKDKDESKDNEEREMDDNDGSEELESEDHENSNNGNEMINIGNVRFRIVYDDLILNVIENRIVSIMKWGYENMMNVESSIINYIDSCYLRNLEHVDLIEDLIQCTIRTIFNNFTNYTLYNIVAGIYNYSMNENNYIFNNNFNIVNEILKYELNRHLRANFNLILINQFIEQNPFPDVNQEEFPMEDIKLVVKKKELENIPKHLYKDVCEEIKIKNDKCLICREDYIECDELSLLPCLHIFHSNCINNWLLKYSHKCPHCRQNTVDYEK
jgi:hypothetical protein